MVTVFKIAVYLVEIHMFRWNLFVLAYSDSMGTWRLNFRNHQPSYSFQLSSNLLYLTRTNCCTDIQGNTK
jgi:hypothetical protein